MIRAGFFGTPAAAVPSLAALQGVASVELVVTRPDRPRGRSGQPAPPAIKSAAVEWGFPLLQPRRASEVTAAISQLDLDVVVVVAYGQLLPPALLATARRGYLNVHFSLLPKWRGAAPVARALQAGDDTTGVSLMVMDAGLDTGPVLAATSTAVRAGERSGELTARLSGLGAGLVTAHLRPYVAGSLEPRSQDDRAATLAPKIAVDDARVATADGGAVLVQAICAFHPWPGAWGLVDGARFKLLKARPVPATATAGGGGVVEGVIERGAGGVVLGTATEAIELVEVQPAGKAAMTAVEWMNGRRGEPARFE